MCPFSRKPVYARVSSDSEDQVNSYIAQVDRAAQFAPFAALSGHAAALVETARSTDRRIDLDEEAKAVLDQKQQILFDRIAEHPEISVTWFQPDPKKEGGQYITTTGYLKRIDEVEQVLILSDSFKISIGDICELESECFGSYF